MDYASQHILVTVKDSPVLELWQNIKLYILRCLCKTGEAGGGRSIYAMVGFRGDLGRGGGYIDQAAA